ncbi:MAG: outer membrane lipoprotein-sorting protein [Deltaproteobacteria bacterium]|nr:outer membrane lipoprotein-sorting protein [Deltaproteobacteria bacterium]
MCKKIKMQDSRCKIQVLHLKFLLATIFLQLATCNLQLSFALTPQEVLEKVDNIRAPDRTFIFNLKVTVKKGDDEDVSEFSVRVKDAKKSLVVFKSPPSNKGRVLLMVEDNMWIYIPGTRNPIRISPQQQIMGRVSNGDVARVVYNLDYNVESLENEGEIIKMTLAAKTKGAAYKSINLWIEKETFKPIKAEFFALSGKLLKTGYYKGYKEILGKERPTIIEIHDGIKEPEISIMEYSNIKLEDTPDAHFQKTFMERVK